MEFIFHYIHGTSLKIFFLRKRGMLHVHVHQERIIVLVAYFEIISTFILILANSIMDDFHINTEDVMCTFDLIW